jgi:hypothetical protein
MHKKHTFEQNRQESINVWTQAQRSALHEAVKNTPVGQPSDGTGVGAGGSFIKPGLKLVFNSVEGAEYYVSNLQDVSDWNNFFELPDFGNPFTSVEVDGATIFLYGGSGIEMRQDLFDGNNSLIEVDDQIGCVVELGDNVFGDDENQGSDNLESVNFPAVTSAGPRCFYRCSSLTSITMPLLETANSSCFSNCESLTKISLPLLKTAQGNCFISCDYLTNINLPMLEFAGNNCFAYCSALTVINLPVLMNTGIYCFNSCTSLKNVMLPALQTVGTYCFTDCTSLKNVMLPACTNLGSSVLNNGVFNNITGKIITLRVPAALMTCNSGNPDGDIQYLQANNTVTITQV